MSDGPGDLRRTITIDLDTGEWVWPTTLFPGDGARVAAAVLPGWSAEDVSKAYGEWLEDDSRPIEEDLINDAATGIDFLLGMQLQIEKVWGRQVDPTDPEAVSKYVREVVLCATDELHEVLAEVHWKPWKDSRGIKDRDKYREELADVLHFILDLYLAAGISGREIVVDYMAKHYKNLERNKSDLYRAS
jgi:NTP pyrophosphatase (non-canonical NTP hydrolase)